MRRESDPLSSGRVTRYRHVVMTAVPTGRYRIGLVRMSGDQRTRDYATRQREAGFSSRDILRKLKRAIAREVYPPDHHARRRARVDDLPPLRQAKTLTLTSAANELGVWPTTISELEGGVRGDDDLAQKLP